MRGCSRAPIASSSGSPAVWTTALVLYQALLLAGYVCAHWAAKGLSPRAQVAGYLLLAVAALGAPGYSPARRRPGWTQ